MLDPGTKLLQNRTQSTDHIGKLCTDSYDSSGPRNYGPRARKTAQNYTKYNSWNGMEVKFEPEMKAVDESGICSPPLWKTSPPRSPQHRANHYRSLSPTSRTQAIARGQRELMEMVKNMPEACYELSLKDIVEQPKVLEARARESSVSEERDLNTEVLYKRENSKKRNDKRAQSQVVKRSASINNGGFYLKMVFPVSLGSKKNNKKKKNDQSSVTNTSAKVSPKPIVQDGSSKGVDKEWWKKRISVSGESESGRSSSNSMKSTGSSSSSSSSSSRSRSTNNRKKSGGCWSFIRNKRRQLRSA
ncbi:uncharacterized protein LOC111984984 [Quercus suber]|uniref:Uncharacterized protein n=1 Tax=Quercus suber TaxID=58331 RepID=A0AAW0KLQ4_QUESU|nr:uncharacterized protein LOC111984984 [Quercus suber]POE85913.1 hypothetical protein CFP56_23501 [Quercus suber]